MVFEKLKLWFLCPIGLLIFLSVISSGSTCFINPSDPAMKQFLLYLDESNALGKKFIIQDIDDTHVFVIAELVNVLQERVGELMDQNAFSLTQK
ncbi:general transcription factor IIH subunit 5 isoform X1 [Nomascus leucogenys]|uniref:general transcription factor IIH subunit 5 isoform X1 n=1 Tax=Nomascus leucogenys TaxID=61853 RepID=UPI00122D5295|nr:general transcription factor IIH subunit 5 isoform X1 [Nomascus leucogenys]